MIYSELLEVILEHEKEIRANLGKEKSSPESIIYAILSYFDKPYLGLTLISEDYPVTFEEERVRLLLSKLLLKSIRLSSILFRRTVKNKTPSIDYLSTLYTKSEEILKQRNQKLLSSDIVLALCIKDMDLENLKLMNKKENLQDVLSLLKTIDQEIYPYVIEQVEQVKERLQEKINKAIAYRDYKAAERFVDEKTLEAFLKDSFQYELKDNLLSITIPFFFKDSKDPLVLSVIRKEKMYYVHDHGCAIRELNKRIASKEVCLEKVNQFVSGSICYLEDDVVIGELNSLPYFSRYLQRLVLIANLDLIDGLYKVMPEYDRERVYPFKGQDDLSDFVNHISNMFKSFYDEKKGLLISTTMCYLGNTTTASYLLETKGSQVTIKDHYNRYGEGAIFENVLYNNDDTIPCPLYVNRVANRFGGEFNNDEVSLTFMYHGKESFKIAFSNFIQMAILLSIIDTLLDLDLIQKKYEIHSYN